MASSGLCNPASTLSPRQKFQAHVRALSTDSLSPSGSQTSPQLFSRVQPRNNNSPQHGSRPNLIFRFSDSSPTSSRNGQYEPPFIREEREAWSRASPSRALRARPQDMYTLQPPHPDSPVIQPSKETRGLKPFAPLAECSDLEERPRTSRGYDHNLAADIDPRPRDSRFAEGSMNERSSGVSSAWLQHGSVSSVSGTESDNDSTPRASPQRSSVDVEEFKPAAVTPATLRQRLVKLGTAFKPHEHTRKQVDASALPPEKKKKGLRKSISMWNIHGIGGKMKASGGSSNDLTPNPPAQDKTLEILNDRKRRAEEAYVQQFSPKKRKSNVGLDMPLHDQAQQNTVFTTQDRPVSRRRSKTPTRTRRRSSSVEAALDFDVLGSLSDIDHHKRPSRRELEKENQQLRAMLRQQHHDPPLDPGHTQSSSTSTCPPQPPASSHGPDIKPAKSTGEKQKQSQEPQVKDVPPVPQIPERVVLKNLSNARNQPQMKTKNSNSNISSNANANANHNVPISSDAVKEVITTTAATIGLPRPVSIILEEDEEGENKSPSHPRVKRLQPSEVEKTKMQEKLAFQVKGLKREQWEWPEDVF